MKLKKKVCNILGKKYFLLGKHNEGTKIWLEAPTYDCVRHWVFGEIKTFSNNVRPETSKETIASSPINVNLIGYVGTDNEFIANPFNAPCLNGGTTFSEDEGNELAELFTRFYTLQDASKLFYFGNSGLFDNPNVSTVKHNKENCMEMFGYINNTMLPDIFNRIEEILTPTQNK